MTHKAQAVGYYPQVILAGRRINDGMGAYVAGQLIKAMLKKRLQIESARVLVLGLAFKENCPDLRNTRVVDVIAELKEYGVVVDVHDPWVSSESAQQEYGFGLTQAPEAGAYDAVILAVAHKEFIEAGIEPIRRFGKGDHVFYDMKSVFSVADSDLRL